jgi:hypothetical protein
MAPSPEQASSVLDDIKEIRLLLNRKTDLYRQLYSFRNYRAGALSLGIWMIAMAALVQVLLMKFGGWSKIPGPVLSVVIGVAVAGAIVVKWVQVRGAIMAKNRLQSNVQLIQMIRDAVLSRTYVTIFSVIIVVVASAIHFHVMVEATRWMPIAAISGGIIFNIIALATRLNEHHVFGYWLIVTGLITLMIGNMQPHLVMALSFGLGSIGYSLVAYIIGGRGK